MCACECQFKAWRLPSARTLSVTFSFFLFILAFVSFQKSLEAHWDDRLCLISPLVCPMIRTPSGREAKQEISFFVSHLPLSPLFIFRCLIPWNIMCSVLEFVNCVHGVRCCTMGMWGICRGQKQRIPGARALHGCKVLHLGAVNQTQALYKSTGCS